MWSLSKSEGVKNRNPGKAATGRRRTVLIWLERVLFVSGLALVVFYGGARLESWWASRAALKEFAQLEAAGRPAADSGLGKTTSDVAHSSTEQLDLPDVDFSLWGQRRIQAYRGGVGTQSANVLAVLQIPKIRLEVPLFDGTDELTLNHAVGRIAGTGRPDEPGNIGIAGHRDGFFRGLKDVSVGDAIELKTTKGTARYIVDQIQIVSPRQVEVLRPRSVPSLTLVTCYPFYFLGSAPQRYIVTASLPQEKDVPVETGIPEEKNLSAPAAEPNSTRRIQMNRFKKANFIGKGAGALIMAILALGTAAAQDSTVTTITHGQPAFETQLKNAEIVYVEGNDLVLKLESGRVEHVIVPDSDKFTIDGREVSVRELVPGTRLTQTITTTTTPRYVNSVRTIEGKVWHVNAPKSVILTLPDNKNQVFNVPNDATFSIDGKEKTVFDLKKGMKITATIVTDEEHTIVESNKVVHGQGAAIMMPREAGVLLFTPWQHPEPTLASAEQPADVLPETGSPLPLIGLLGASAIAMSFGLWAVRRTRTI